MAYIVTEIQVNKAGEAANITTAYTDMPTAWNKYYTILASAAVSNVYKHAAFLYTEDGYLAHNCFTHDGEETVAQ